jgi:hypothetical protein
MYWLLNGEGYGPADMAGRRAFTRSDCVIWVKATISQMCRHAFQEGHLIFALIRLKGRSELPCVRKMTSFVSDGQGLKFRRWAVGSGQAGVRMVRKEQRGKGRSIALARIEDPKTAAEINAYALEG